MRNIDRFLKEVYQPAQLGAHSQADRYRLLLAQAKALVLRTYLNQPLDVNRLAFDMLVPWRDHIADMAYKFAAVVNHWMRCGAPFLNGYYGQHIARGPFDALQLMPLPNTTPSVSIESLLQLNIVKRGGLTDHDVRAYIPSQFYHPRRLKKLPPTGSAVLEQLKPLWSDGFRIVTESEEALLYSGMLLVRSLLSAGGLLNGYLGLAWALLANGHLSASPLQLMRSMLGLPALTPLSSVHMELFRMSFGRMFSSASPASSWIQSLDRFDAPEPIVRLKFRFEQPQRVAFLTLLSLPAASFDASNQVLTLQFPSQLANQEQEEAHPLFTGHVGLNFIAPYLLSLAHEAQRVHLSTPNAEALLLLAPLREHAHVFESEDGHRHSYEEQPDVLP